MADDDTRRIFTSRTEFHDALRSAFAAAADAGCREVWICDDDFADWPLSERAWEKQTSALVAAGYRVIAYDRRGFGRSSHPWSGYDFDTFTQDLHHLMTQLDLRDVALVGFSCARQRLARAKVPKSLKRTPISRITLCATGAVSWRM